MPVWREVEITRNFYQESLNSIKFARQPRKLNHKYEFLVPSIIKQAQSREDKIQGCRKVPTEDTAKHHGFPTFLQDLPAHQKLSYF